MTAASTASPVPLRHWQAVEKNLRAAIANDLAGKYIKDLYPSNNPPPKPFVPPPPEKSWLENVAPVVDKVLPAVETLLFVAGPEGIAASAGLGLMWAFLRPQQKPQQQRQVHESMSKACQLAIDGALKSDHIRQSANSLKNFQDWLHEKRSLFDLVTMDDEKSLEDDVLNYLKDAVLPSGVLIKAFDELLDTLGWFDDNHDQLVGLAVQSVFEAYSLRLGAYIARAYLHRSHSEWHKYNESLGYIRDIVISMTERVPKLIDRVEQKLKDLQQVRRDGISVKYIEEEYAGKTAYLYDACSKNTMRVAGGQSDEMLKMSFNDYKKGYMARLEAHFPHCPTVLRPFLVDLRDQQDLLLSKQGPSNPMYAPSIVAAPIDVGKPADWPQGTALSYRYKLTDGKGGALSKPSPWSKWVVQGAPNTRAQILVGDGYAVLDTTREIWATMKLVGESTDKPPEPNVTEVKLGEIKGHGIIAWPSTPLDPMI